MLKLIIEHLKEIVILGIFLSILGMFIFVKKFAKSVSDLDWTRWKRILRNSFLTDVAKTIDNMI